MGKTEKFEILGRIHSKGIVAVIRAESADSGRKIADAVFEGGIPAIELTMTVPGALSIIETMAEYYKGRDIILGAGTVMDPETARLCILGGAQYVVSPILNPEVVKMCNRYGIPAMPGIGTVTELVKAMELGVDVVKCFPGEVLGPAFIKAVHGPVPEAKIMPTGGVSLSNIQKWLEAGAFALGMGSALTKPDGRKDDYQAIARTAQKVIRQIVDFRKT
ncbi:MAG: bifunctional 2-keto-4-hydroxyglutarate aldolase/2-keto-3-deoxy-6-phosphogluconate aldolase [Synergistota bacterium]|jgi:2-dehydro-3-deoxyphosphogluconate aldolase/(4S)-4-hydroxy-2-oxoglutarate aldolase|nr:bifunctional 2-keto-4-hydroxyglutarate aldolase/2-keto-3-deoxy-6-phosphogluconate aldolase [Synergistota bacterium]